MKKALCVILIILFLCSCTVQDGRTNAGYSKKKMIGVWISCYELETMFSGGNFKDNFSDISHRLSSIGVSDAFVHVRAFGDSLFESKYYPQNESTKKYDFDVLAYMIEILKENGIRFHAWINPFRAGDGSFNNPADKTVRAKIVSGIREILDKYDVAGIHFDDYFYPPQDLSVDEDTFADYSAASGTAMTLDEYRTASITSLVYLVKNAVKHKDKQILFSISPAADIEKDQNEAFADISYWCESGVADLIIPQLYFGFDYPQDKFRFENLLGTWQALPRDKDTKLIIGLASYKLGTDIKPDCEEWKNGVDILARQADACLKSDDISGVCFFSYSSLFYEDELHAASLKALSEVLKGQGTDNT